MSDFSRINESARARVQPEVGQYLLLRTASGELNEVEVVACHDYSVELAIVHAHLPRRMWPKAWSTTYLGLERAMKRVQPFPGEVSA